MELSEKDLMVGDWVLIKEKPIRISIQDLVCIHQGRECEPMPLTAEILEKNGFKEAPAKDTDAHNLVGKWWHKSGDVYVKKYCLSHGTYAYTVGFHPYTRIENIHYVHELQHALRLCGLGDLAEHLIIN